MINAIIALLIWAGAIAFVLMLCYAIDYGLWLRKERKRIEKELKKYDS